MSTFIKLVIKALKFTVNRPLQRFNIYNRAQKYLGPDAKYFRPAPRAIGAMSGLKGKPIAYPQLERPTTSDSEHNLVIEASKGLEVKKIEPPPPPQPAEEAPKLARPLPKCTNLPMQDPASIWQINKTPKGRLNLDMLQEIMINKLGDPEHSTPKAVAEKYNIREEYAEKLFNSLKQIRIVVSPRIKKNLDLVGKDNPFYQATKHLVYHVDTSLRDENDKKFDEMFLPKHEQLDEEVKELLEPPPSQSLVAASPSPIKRPRPLRIAPANAPPSQEPARIAPAKAPSSQKPPRIAPANAPPPPSQQPARDVESQ